MKNSHQNKRNGKLLGIYKFLQTLYQEFQLYSKISQWTQEKERSEMRRRMPRSIQRIKEKENSEWRQTH